MKNTPWKFAFCFRVSIVEYEPSSNRERAIKTNEFLESRGVAKCHTSITLLSPLFIFLFFFFFWLSKRNLNWMEQTGRSIDYRGTTAKNRSINAKHLSGIISSAYFIESDWKLSGMCGDALIQVDSSQFLWLLFIDGHIEGELTVNWFTGNRKLIDGSSRRTCDSTVNSINSNRSCRCRHRTSGQESRWLLHYFVFIWLGFQLIPAPLIHSELWKWQTNWSWPINRSLSLTRSRLPHHRFNQTRPVTSTGRKTFIYFVLHF